MTPAEYETKFPLILGWIKTTLAQHKGDACQVSERGFQRLPDHYDPKTLEFAKVVYIRDVPMPPLSALGLAQFADFERMRPGGITYLDTFFVRQELRDDEAIHFHELVHIIQWRALGPKRFLAAYADGLERIGYEHCPLEVMAYTLGSVFQNPSHLFEVAGVVHEELARQHPEWKTELSA